MVGEENLFDQALAAARQRDFATARSLLKQLLKQEPQNINAWLLGAQVVETAADAIRCYERVLKIDPNHAYARQKLTELRAIIPDAPAAPSTYAASRDIPARPIPVQPEVEQFGSKPVDNSDKVRREITIALSGLLVICCLAALAIAALPYISGSQMAQSTPTNQELFEVIYDNVRAANSEDLDAYMSTIHPGSFTALTTRPALELIFSEYDLNFYFYNLKVISASTDEAKVSFSLETTRISGPDFADNIITGTMILRRDNGQWKIYSQEDENIEYK